MRPGESGRNSLATPGCCQKQSSTHLWTFSWLLSPCTIQPRTPTLSPACQGPRLQRASLIKCRLNGFGLREDAIWYHRTFTLIYLGMSMCMTHMSQHIRGGQRTACGNRFSDTTWIPRIKLSEHWAWQHTLHLLGLHASPPF